MIDPLVHEHLELFLDNAKPLITSAETIPLRRIVSSALSTISCAISSLPGSELECVLSDIVSIVTGAAVPEIHRKALRTTFERLSAKLVKKCGFNQIGSILVDLRSQANGKDDKRLKHLFKTLARSCRNTGKSKDKRSKKLDSDSEDSNEDNSEKNENKRKAIAVRRRKKMGMDLLEDADDITNVVTPGSALKAAARQINKTTPKTAKSVDTGDDKIVVKKPKRNGNFSEDESGSVDDFNMDDSDAESLTEKKVRKKNASKTGKNGKRQKISAGKSMAKKGMQPFSYRPLQRQMLNRRGSKRNQSNNH